MGKRPSWDEAVDRAKRANGKSFESFMEIAEASFDAVPENGKGGTHGRTLADFADQADVGYVSLMQYRQTRKWLGDSMDVHTISARVSYSTAFEAARIGESIEDLLARQENEPPEGFNRWTVDAHRVARGKRPTNTGRLAQKVKQAGADADADDLAAAAAEDKLAEAEAEAGAIKNHRKGTTLGSKARETGRRIDDDIADKTPTYVPDQTILSFQDWLRKMNIRDLPGQIAHHAARLQEELDLVDEFREKYGDEVFEDEEGSFTLNEELDTVLSEEHAKTDLKFSLARGLQPTTTTTED